MATFTWVPSYTTNLTTKHRIRTISFGDGYEQRSPESINASKDSYELVFENISASVGDSIETFLKAGTGSGRAHIAEKFTWTAPGKSTSQKWISKEDFKKTHVAPGLVTITCVFDEVFEA